MSRPGAPTTPVIPDAYRPVCGPGAALVVGGGCAVLILRPALLRAVSEPTTAIVVLFVGLLAVGLAWPLAADGACPPARLVVAVLGLGIAAFAIGRVLGGGRPPAPFTLRLVALNSLAAVAEEAFFRRLAYGVLSASGPAAAVAGTAVLFAIVHVTVYGAWVLPIDLAAGLILGWQRWASGSWLSPAATHVVANLLVVL